jgi:hypothetical protein
MAALTQDRKSLPTIFVAASRPEEVIVASKTAVKLKENNDEVIANFINN